MEKFAEWLEATSPEVLEKLAEAEQDRFFEKLMPLLEKQAEYTVYLIKKAAEEMEQEIPSQQQQQATQEEVTELPKKPETSGKDNIDVDPVTKSEPGIKVNDITLAVQEAIAQGQLDKITTFVKAIMSNYPDAVDDVIKIVKVELQDAGMKQIISVEDAVKVSDALNLLLEGGSAE